jgi:hypothetical protein
MVWASLGKVKTIAAYHAVIDRRIRRIPLANGHRCERSAADFTAFGRTSASTYLLTA